jgi:hypothetical protein
MATKNKRETRRPAEAYVEVEFGTPSNHCLHMGICHVTIPQAGSLNPCPCRAKAWLRSWEGRGVVFSFLKDEMSASTMRRHFYEGFFTVVESYSLPPEVAAAIDFACEIMPGRYPVQETEDCLMVIFA